MEAPAGSIRRTVVAVASFAALASAFVGVSITVPRLEEWRDDYGALSQPLRDDPIALFLGFDPDVWRRLARAVGRGDRYAVVARGERRFEVRNYAAFSLLPAVQVPDPDDANVVIYYDTRPPPRPRCLTIGEDVCLVRREAP